MTIKDIARACNVSVSTVSRVLNERPDVSEDVRRRVLAEVEAQGYIPNNGARTLVCGQSNSIGVVVRGTGNLFFSALIKIIAEAIESKGYTMVLHFIGSDADEVKAGAILEREKKLRGLIFLGGRFDYTLPELSLIGVPYVCCTYTNSFGSLPEGEFASVSIDDYATAYKAMNHLVELGHRRIAIVIPSCNDRSISELRYNGCRAAMEAAGIDFDPRLLVETDGCFEMPEAYEGACRLIDSGVDFTAVFTPSDTTAMAVMKALEDRGRRVPDDCSVIAIDGLSVSEYITPTLSTMVQPVEELGRESVDMLADMIEGRAIPRRVLLDTKLRRGASAASI